jgi:hypothetical protein
MRSRCGYATVTAADACATDTGVFLRWFTDQDDCEHAGGEARQKRIDGAVTAETVDL